MKRLGTAILIGIVAAGIGAPSVTAQPRTPAAPDVGAPPSGAIPILFNDRHVHATPDRLKRNRVLAALVRGNTILVPLRSLFEQTGATVSYDPAAKTVDVSKPGSDLKVTVGRPEVVFNGERRPLDVPPEIDQGSVLVPLRVIGEGMGAYVQWVPERKTVVVRYLAAAPPSPPSPEPSAAVPPETPAETPTPAATRTPLAPAKPRVRYDRFVTGSDLFKPKVNNEFSPGNTGAGVSYAARGALEFRLFRLPLMLAGEYQRIRYPHNDNGTGRPGDPGFVTVIGGYGQTDVPAFIAKDTDFDGRLGVRIAAPRIYLAAGYLHREDTYGYPKQNGYGFGIEKLPDLERTFSLYGSGYYFPDVNGNFAYPRDLYTCPLGPTLACPAGSTFGTTAKFADRILKYQVGVAIVLTGAKNPLGLFIEGGYLGDSIRGKSLSPGDAAHNAAYLGLGLKL